MREGAPSIERFAMRGDLWWATTTTMKTSELRRRRASCEWRDRGFGLLCIGFGVWSALYWGLVCGFGFWFSDLLIALCWGLVFFFFFFFFENMWVCYLGNLLGLLWAWLCLCYKLFSFQILVQNFFFGFYFYLFLFLIWECS